MLVTRELTRCGSAKTEKGGETHRPFKSRRLVRRTIPGYSARIYSVKTATVACVEDGTEIKKHDGRAERNSEEHALRRILRIVSLHAGGRRTFNYITHGGRGRFAGSRQFEVPSIFVELRRFHVWRLPAEGFLLARNLGEPRLPSNKAGPSRPRRTSYPKQPPTKDALPPRFYPASHSVTGDTASGPGLPLWGELQDLGSAN